jgi:uncharacterized protein (DUF2384 family)
MSVLTHVLPKAHAKSGDLHALAMAEVYGVKPPMMAQMLGVSRQALLKTPTSQRLQPKLRQLEQLFIRTRDLTGSELNARIWLKAGHPDFAGKAPIEYLQEENFEPVEDLVLSLEMGLPR